jgi:plastocyanin
MSNPLHPRYRQGHRPLSLVAALLITAAPFIAGCGAQTAGSNASASDYAASYSTGGGAAGSQTSAGSSSGSVKLGDFLFNDLGTMDAVGKPDLALGVRGLAFSPTFIRGTPGQKLTLKMENATSTPHTFTLADQMIDQSLAPNGKAEFSIAFPASGVLRFFCRLHETAGMNGELLAGDARPQAPAAGSTAPRAPASDPYGYGY